MNYMSHIKPITTYRGHTATEYATALTKLALICMVTFATAQKATAQYKIVGETCTDPNDGLVTGAYFPPPTTCDYAYTSETPTNELTFSPWLITNQFIDSNKPAVDRRIAVEGIIPLGKIILRYPEVYDESDIPTRKPKETITVTVKNNIGTVIPGEIHLISEPQRIQSDKQFTIYWRSDETLELSTDYQVSIAFDNKAIAPCPDTSHIENTIVDFDVKTQDTFASEAAPPIIDSVNLGKIEDLSSDKSQPCCTVASEQQTETICWQNKPGQRADIANRPAFHTIGGKIVTAYILPGSRYLVDTDKKELKDSSPELQLYLLANQLADEYCIVETAYDMLADIRLVSEPFCLTNNHHDQFLSNTKENRSKIDDCINATIDEKNTAKDSFNGFGFKKSSNPRQWLSKADADIALESRRSTESRCDYQTARVASATEQAMLEADANDAETKASIDENGCNNSLGTQPGLYALLLFVLMYIRGRRFSYRSIRPD